MSEIVNNFQGLYPDIIAGAAVGKAFEILGLEGYAHQQLAHANMQLSPPIEQVARLGMNLSGMSPNRFALEHRLHHTLKSAPPEGVTGTLAHIIRAGTGREEGLDSNNPDIRLAGVLPEADPLLVDTDDGVKFRYDSKLERLAGRKGPARFLPLAGLTLSVYAANRLANRPEAGKRSLAFIISMQVGLTTQAVFTAAAEGTAGMKDGVLDTEHVHPLIKRRILRHQEHHNDPANPEAGSAPRHRIVFRSMGRFGLIKKLI
jgi:hypothetical protein